MNAAIEFTTASAGSGKTFRLVEIVAKAIEDGSARPQGIVATTFTVAAANELRERLAAKFYEAGRYQDAVLLGSGMIGTVHGICLDLLSRFSLQAGLSPEVTILDDTQSQILLSRAFDAILSGDEENEIYQLSSRLAQIDAQTGTHHYRLAIPKIVADARSNDIDPAALPAMGLASWQEMKAALPAPTSEDLDAALAAAISGALQEIDPNSKVGVVQTYRKLLLDSARALKNGKLGWADWNIAGADSRSPCAKVSSVMRRVQLRCKSSDLAVCATSAHLSTVPSSRWRSSACSRSKPASLVCFARKCDTISKWREKSV